jgi:hypothetical protein
MGWENAADVDRSLSENNDLQTTRILVCRNLTERTGKSSVIGLIKGIE